MDAAHGRSGHCHVGMRQTTFGEALAQNRGKQTLSLIWINCSLCNEVCIAAGAGHALLTPMSSGMMPNFLDVTGRLHSHIDWIPCR